jgi:hypothetical protein
VDLEAEVLENHPVRRQALALFHATIFANVARRDLRNRKMGRARRRTRAENQEAAALTGYAWLSGVNPSDGNADRR